eukprot:1090532-Pyramimonas_sp.AAC.1
MVQGLCPQVVSCEGVGWPWSTWSFGGSARGPVWAPPWAPDGALRRTLRWLDCDEGCAPGSPGVL